MSDTGEGMKPEFLPYVFHRFRQEESSITRKAGGLGLGLAVVRHLVELHGGNVSADSAGPGQGSTFIVELPLAPLPADVAKRDGTATRDSLVEDETKTDAEVLSKRGELDGIRVLLVEDDEDTRVLLQVMLERRGAQVVTASSSAEALQWFQKIGTGSDSDRPKGAVTRKQKVTPQSSRADSVTAAHEDSTGSDSNRVIAAQQGPTAPHEVSTGSDSDRVIVAASADSRTAQPPGARATPTGVDIIISDLGMPEEDGYEFMRKLRLMSPSSAPAPGIPAIALTGYATSKDRERALSAGYQQHLAKPLEPQELVETILTLVRP